MQQLRIQLVLVCLVLGIFAAPQCGPLRPATADAIEHTVEVACDLVETWCDPGVIVTAPARWCSTAVMGCRAGQGAVAFLLPSFTEAPETQAMKSAGATPVLTVCADWGEWCAHTDSPDAAPLCAAVEDGCLSGEAVTIEAVPVGAHD